jgi:hypothetical protein
VPTYGIRITAYRHGEVHRSLHAREVNAPDRRTAEGYAFGWLAFEGYNPEKSTVEVVTDGVTFAEHMTRKLTAMAGRLSLRYDVSVEGPFTWEDSDGKPHTSVRLYLPNGWGVSVRSALSSSGYADTEVAVIREDKNDQHGWVLDGAGVQEYPEGVGVGEEFDADTGKIIEKLAKLPLSVTNGSR